ncbi:MAG: hypothetical protein JWP36_1546 [Paucimonas sp.]|nr:hypothetical protein [Paucimonas sp.]
MHFPVVIHKEERTVYGVTVPDVPGCHSWGHTTEAALENAKIAICSHLETLRELGEQAAVSCTAMEELAKAPCYADGSWKLWALVEIDQGMLDQGTATLSVIAQESRGSRSN